MTRVSGMTGMNGIDRMTTVWHKIFARSNFCVFCNFSSDLQNNNNNNNDNNNNIYRGSPTRQRGFQWGPHTLI